MITIRANVTYLDQKGTGNTMTSIDSRNDLDIEKEVISPLAHAFEKTFFPTNAYLDSNFTSIVRENLRTPVQEVTVDYTCESIEDVMNKIEGLWNGGAQNRIRFEVRKGIRLLEEVYSKGYKCLFSLFLEDHMPSEMCKEILDYVEVEHRENQDWDALYEWLGLDENNTA